MKALFDKYLELFNKDKVSTLIITVISIGILVFLGHFFATSAFQANDGITTSARLDKNNSGDFAESETDEMPFIPSIEPTPQIRKIGIHIKGAVVNPGFYEIDDPSRVKDAIDAAEGMTENGSLENVNLAEHLDDGDEIYISSNEEIAAAKKKGNGYVPPALKKSINSSNYSTSSADALKVDPSQMINLNSATEAQLCTIKGIGESTAKKIIAYREKIGRFRKIEDIMNVSGISEKKFESMKPYLYIE